MSNVASFDPVEYLIRRKYGGALLSYDQFTQLRAVRAYRAILEDMPPETLAQLCAQSAAKESVSSPVASVSSQPIPA